MRELTEKEIEDFEKNTSKSFIEKMKKKTQSLNDQISRDSATDKIHIECKNEDKST